jgi:hypothetical protein
VIIAVVSTAALMGAIMALRGRRRK